MSKIFMRGDDEGIFASGGRPYGNATLGFSFGTDAHHLYAYGFRRAADLLVQHVHEKHTSLDVLVYPVLFLYRHHLELAIKLVIRDARTSLQEPTTKDDRHGLTSLWQEAKELTGRALGAEQVGLEPVDRVVAGMAEIDPRSTAFRYPESLDGSAHLVGLPSVNFLAFHEAVAPALDLLDALHTCLAVDAEARQESALPSVRTAG